MTEGPLRDADFAYFRFVVFGELPARIKPDEYVEMVETDTKPGRPESAVSEAQYDALHSCG
jgi:hypothetical protein